MEAKTKDLWIFIETKEDGSAKNVGIELLNPGRKLADKQAGKLVAVVVGHKVDEAVRLAGVHGADQIIVIDSKEYSQYATDSYTGAMTYLVEKYAPMSLLIGATPDGRDLAPRLACRVDTGLTADCTGLDIKEENGGIEWTRPAFGGNLMAVILCPDQRPQMGTVRPGVFKKPETGENKAEVIYEEFHVAEEDIRTKIIEIIREVGETVDLEGADIIVSGGRGIGGVEGFALLTELAEEIGGVVGASRAAVDEGWISHSHQVGQTGKTVGPKLYIACGISGAIQHVAGMSSSDVIVAVNKDPDATIFGIADYGVVGNLFEVVPELIAEIKRARG
ncbi:electron transfer flavoprotein subunit alpha/FixB family protein [Lachnospiraceae bacterium ZAX-1]